MAGLISIAERKFVSSMAPLAALEWKLSLGSESLAMRQLPSSCSIAL